MGRNTFDSSAPDTVVLIHGLWMTPLSWEHWIQRYSNRGYRVIAPSWPGMDVDIAQLRRDPSPIARLGAREIVDHYARIIRRLVSPPIIMGHSFGGGFVQLLLDRGLGAAGVAIDSAPVRGVLGLPFSTIRSAWPILRNPANINKAVALTPEQFHYAFTNTLNERASAKAFERYHVPGAGRVLFQGALANLNPRTVFRVDFARDNRAPLLLIAGGSDHIVPAWINKSNAAHYRKSRAVTGYRMFPGRSHYTLGQEGWEEVADYALNWAARNATARAAGSSRLHQVPELRPDVKVVVPAAK
jgi:alpha-beta hydrolase superfamily lysophospholipase